MTEATNVEILKALGHLPGVTLADLGTAAAAALVTETDIREISSRRCYHPDRGDAEIADADPGKLASSLKCSDVEADFFKAAHQRMVKWEATGRGSFPSGCYPDWPDNHAVAVYLEFESFPSHYTRPVTADELNDILRAKTWGLSREQVFDRWNGKPMVNVAMDLANEAYRRVGVVHVMKNDGPEGEHNIHIKAERIPGSTIGYAYFNDQTCGDHVNNRIDSTWRPGLMDCARLLAHECGHNHNLEHTFSGESRHHGIMSYNDPPSGLFYGYSTGKAPHTLPLDPSLATLKRYYGGEPVPVGPEPEPPGPPDAGAVEVIDGQIVFRVNGQDHKFVLMPWE